MARAPDALTRKQAFVAAWNRLKWFIFFIIFGTPFISYGVLWLMTINHHMVHMQYVLIGMIEITYVPIFTAGTFYTQYDAIRSAPTPMEREARDRALLARLKCEYEGQ